MRQRQRVTPRRTRHENDSSGTTPTGRREYASSTRRSNSVTPSVVVGQAQAPEALVAALAAHQRDERVRRRRRWSGAARPLRVKAKCPDRSIRSRCCDFDHDVMPPGIDRLRCGSARSSSARAGSSSSIGRRSVVTDLVTRGAGLEHADATMEPLPRQLGARHARHRRPVGVHGREHPAGSQQARHLVERRDRLHPVHGLHREHDVGAAGVEPRRRRRARPVGDPGNRHATRLGPACRRWVRCRRPPRPTLLPTVTTGPVPLPRSTTAVATTRRVRRPAADRAPAARMAGWRRTGRRSQRIAACWRCVQSRPPP